MLEFPDGGHMYINIDTTIPAVGVSNSMLLLNLWLLQREPRVGKMHSGVKNVIGLK
jgi:hypothetical protein